jgi:hypothetical protein
MGQQNFLKYFIHWDGRNIFDVIMLLVHQKKKTTEI